ncbi:MAG: hypothetical protein ACU4EQ_12395 [Candidatus Nitrosoglobus sp.]
MLPAGGEAAGYEAVVNSGGDGGRCRSASGDLCAAAARAASKPPGERQRPEHRRSMIGQVANARVLQINSLDSAHLRPIEPVARRINWLERVLSLQLREQPESAGDSEVGYGARGHCR